MGFSASFSFLRSVNEAEWQQRRPAPGRLRGAGACLPPGKLGDVITDVLAALMEAFELGIGEVESVDLLNALGTNYAGDDVKMPSSPYWPHMRVDAESTAYSVQPLPS